MKPSEPIPVKLFVGVLYSEENLLKPTLESLEKQFGEIDYKSSEFKFYFSSYYETEMGSPIFRLFFSFEKLINPGKLAQIKIQTNKTEEDLARISHDNKKKVALFLV